MTFIRNFDHFQYFDFTINFLDNENLFQKTGVSLFWLKVLRLKLHHFHTKLPCQELTLTQIEWGVQNAPITKNGVLSITTLFLRIFCFSLRTPYKELILCANSLNVNIHIFRRRWSFIGGCFFPVSFFPVWQIARHLVDQVFLY